VIDVRVLWRIEWWMALLACAWLAGCATKSTTDTARGDSGSVIPVSTEETEDRRRARIKLELASGYYQQHNYNVALEELRQALSVDPTYPAAYGLLGLIYMELGEQGKAEESFQRGLKLAPNDSDLNNNYGWFLCRGGHERQSMEYFIRATRNPLYATPARPLHNAGICSLRIGDEAGAETYFQRAFQIEPGNPVAMYNLAELYLKRGEFERARFYAKRLLTNFDPNAETLWLGVRLERRAGNSDGEASYSSQLRRRFPQSREASLLLSGQYDQ
jgi:type IV pilus assembly protein PilF